MRFIYKTDIFDAVISTLLKENKLNYSRLYDKVIQVLGRALSNRDFSMHLEKMSKENTLHKEDPGKRGSKVSYSLTENAKKENRLKILGIDENAEKRRILYQLLFLFELYGSDYEITEQDLDEFLSYIPASRKDMVVDYIGDVKMKGVAVLTFYKPVMGVEIMCIGSTKGKHDKAGNIYNIKLPGVSIRDFLNPNSNRHLSFSLPFDYINFTRKDVIDGIDVLQKANLIRPIMNINGETRYSLVNNQLRDLFDKIYCIHVRRLSFLEGKWSNYEKPTDDERKQIEFVYGKRKADKIINACYFRKQVRKKNQDRFLPVQHERNSYETGMNKINNDIQKLKEKYGNILSNYGFNEDFIESVSFMKNIQ